MGLDCRRLGDTDRGAVQSHVLRAVEVFVAPTVFCIVILFVVFPRMFPLRYVQDVAASFAGIIRSAPLLAPLVLVLLIVPLLQADVWRIATSFLRRGV